MYNQQVKHEHGRPKFNTALKPISQLKQKKKSIHLNLEIHKEIPHVQHLKDFHNSD